MEHESQRWCSGADVHWLFTWNFGVMASGAVVTLTVIVTPDRGPAAGEVMDDASEVPHASDA